LLKSLTLQNFRGFSEHRIEFGPEAILIGQNNAGKTTAIEALRVLSVCQTRAQSASFIGCPQWLSPHCQGAGFRPSLEIIDFDFANVQHGYDADSPAIIRAKFRNNSEVHIFIGRSQEEVFCQLRIGARKIIHSRTEMGGRLFGSVKVMPPVGSLLPREKVIAKERLNRYLDGYLAYRHFRNQLWERPADYRLFKQLLEDTWHGLKIQHFENDHGNDRNEYSLLIREGRFTSEVSWHGHGLQAWLQTIWFLARVSKKSTVVLDEPDVYLHADLQRKLIKVIEGLGFSQAIIATHSSEIIGDVPFQNVVVIQKQERVSRSADNASQIQHALRGMGSLHSIQLSKVAQRGLILFVEGDDKAFLSDIAYKLGSRVFDSFSKIAIQELKGKGNWQHALGAAKALKQASDGEVQTALLIDSDYMLIEQRADHYRRALAADLALKIWSRKEIENYLISPEVISRLVTSRCDEAELTVEDASQLIEEVEAESRNDIILSFADVIQKAAHPRIEAKTAYQRAEALVLARLASGLRLADLASGKDFIGALSAKLQNRLGVSLTPLSLCKEMRVSEIPAELGEYVTMLCAPGRLNPAAYTEVLSE
jgi:hypothetical protein